ncbi:pilus assembly protein [Roseateles sp. UC29_93]|uniref:pilus assembly protein n=1 Tax=Roseateles sp. UC29_93 TaxID=3350177 RepID=UPI003670FB0E
MNALLRARIRASLIHLGFSALVAISAAAAVFLLWYPWPYTEISGGAQLFLLVTGVDLVMGPLITLVIFDVRKPRRELWRDLCIVVILQLSGLGYGAYTMHEARPVVLALEEDRFRVVIAASVQTQELPQAPTELGTLSLTGPRLVGTRQPDSTDRADAVFQALAGSDLGMRPRYWTAWDALSRAKALNAGFRLETMIKERAGGRPGPELAEAIARTGLPVQQLRAVPLIARRDGWSVLVDERTGDPVGFAPIDSF